VPEHDAVTELAWTKRKGLVPGTASPSAKDMTDEEQMVKLLQVGD
jgi:hypothetical protein